MSNMTTMYDKARKAVITGAIAGIASSVVFGENGTSDAFGVTMPVSAAIGVANGLSSLAADLSHEYVLPELPQNAKYATLESTVLGLGVAGGSTAYILNRENLGGASTMNAFVLGAASYAAGDYIDNKFFQSPTAFSQFN
jgi:hypothetical protein